MSGILVYSPSPLYARALAEALDGDAAAAESWPAAQETLRRVPSPPLFILDAGFTPEDGKKPAHLADPEDIPPEIPVILLASPGGVSPAADRAGIFTIVLPLALADLRARIAQLLPPGGGAQALSLGDAGRFLPSRRELARRGGVEAPVVLTEKETDILLYLLERQDVFCSREELLKALWGYADGVDTRTLETHIYRLRGKLEALFGAEIAVVSGPEGYRLVIHSG